MKRCSEFNPSNVCITHSVITPSIGYLRCYAHNRTLGRPLLMLYERIVHPGVQCRSKGVEGVRIWIHAKIRFLLCWGMFLVAKVVG